MLQPAKLDDTLVIQQSEDQYEPFQVRVDSKPRAPFLISSPYVVGDFVTKVTDDGSVFMVVTAGTSTSSEPTWPTVMGGRVTSGTAVFMKVDTTRMLDTTAYSARWKIREDPGSTVYASGSNADGRCEVGFSPSKWAVATAYVAGNQVVPTTPNGWVYQVETAGTSHATTEPTWTTTLGAVNASTDNGVVWRNVKTDADVSNVRVALTPSYTGTLDFDVGYFFLDLIDTFGKQIPVVGVAPNPGAGTFAAKGMTAVTTVADGTGALSSGGLTGGRYVLMTTDATSGHKVLVHTDTNWRTAWNTEAIFHIRPTDVANVRIWLGLFAADPSGSSTLTSEHVGLRFDDSLDTVWKIHTADGTTANSANGGAAPVSGTDTILRLVLSSTKARFFIDDAFGAELTANLPANTTELSAYVSITTRTTAAKALRCGWCNFLSN
jgi:hypothetical protein